MRVVAVVNQKGGTAKTSTSVNLGAALAEQGCKVVVIDLDPQGNATEWLGCALGGELAEVITDGRRLDDILQPTGIAGLEVAPASLALAAADRQLSGEPGIQTALRAAIQGMSPRDVVLIDCQPSLGLLVLLALAAANEVLVPVAAASMELKGLAELTRTIDKVRLRLNPQLLLAAVLACRVDVRGRHTSRIATDVIASLRRRFPDQLLDAVVHESVRLREAPSHAEPITVYDPDSTVAGDYRAVAAELLGRWGADHARG